MGLVMNELHEFVDTEPPKPWEMTVPDRHEIRPAMDRKPLNYGLKKCAICGTEFKPKASNSKYCSAECKRQRDNERCRQWRKQRENDRKRREAVRAESKKEANTD